MSKAPDIAASSGIDPESTGPEASAVPELGTDSGSDSAAGPGTNDGADPGETEPAGDTDGDFEPLSLRTQLTIWFALSFGVILGTVIAGLIVLDRGSIFKGDFEHYNWLIRLALGAAATALVGGTAAAWVIVGSALEPLRKITESARGVAPERIDETRITMPEIGTEVKEAQRELNFALDRIEAGYQAQERFISNVSHELKTPIAVVLTEARRLRRRERPMGELEEFIEDTGDQMARLGKMVESFLTLARIDYEERLQKNEEFWFQDLLVEAVSRSNAQALAHDVHVELELADDFEFFDEPTWGDPELVSSAVENLIRNAIRFSPRGSIVHVSVEGEPPDPEPTPKPEPAKASGRGKGQKHKVEVDPAAYLASRPRAVIRVRDRGPGMPEDLIATAFQPFKQAESERGQSRGTGLGLAIAHKVSELHRGSIRAFNRRDGLTGCVLEVRLPFLKDTDWSADRHVTADLTKGGIGSGIRKKSAD